MIELEQCPFCGGSVFMWEDAVQQTPKIGRVVECENCGIRTVIPWAVEISQASAVWNHRVKPNKRPSLGITLASAMLKGLGQFEMGCGEDTND